MKTANRTIAAMVAAIALAAPAAAQDEWARWYAPAANGQFVLLQRQGRDDAGRARQAQGRGIPQQRAFLRWPEVTETFSRTVRLGRNGTFDLQGVAGDVAITGGRGDDVRIDATKRVRHPVEAQARAALADVRIDITQRGGNVEVRTQQSRSRPPVWTAVDYVVNLPSGANVVIGTISGNVRVRNIDGELRTNTVSGNVVAADARRVREITTVSGNVEVSDGEADELTANTMGGDLVLRNLKARVLDLTTVNGDVRLLDIDAMRAHLQSMAGNLEYAGRFARSGRYEFQTHSGQIRVSPLGNPSFDVDASTLRGALRSDFVLKLFEQVPPGPRRAVQKTLRGTFGDAAAVLTAQSFSGDIIIVKR
jgi:DUF4097 and DUF4098 domain-containing protein YvlB